MLFVAYEGTQYEGFQRQKERPTIQYALERAIQCVTREKEVVVYGAGRTDAGVHARKQVVHFHTNITVPIERWCLAINAYLPRDIVVWKAYEAVPGFHARRSKHYKTYEYTVCNALTPDPMLRNQQWHIVKPLDTEAMHQALQHLVGEHDFTSFCSIHSSVQTRVRRLIQCAVRATPSGYAPCGGRWVQISLTGNGFLYNMVRIIVGTLIQVGHHHKNPDDIKYILETRSREHAGPTAPPHGLMLWDIVYVGQSFDEYETQNAF